MIKKVRVALVYPSYSEIFGRSEHRRFEIYAGQGRIPERPHVGMGFLSEALTRNNIDHRYYDMNLMESYLDLRKDLRKYKPDVIGLTMVTPGYLKGYDLIKQLRKDFKKARLIAGGPHVTLKSEAILKECKNLDVGFISEAEQSLVDFVKNNCKCDKVNGVVYRRKGKIIFNPPILPDDINIYGFPKYEKFDLKKYSDVTLYTSRGCPFRCVFCTIGTYNRKRFRPRSAVNVMEEIKYWYEKGQRMFPVDDDNFVFDSKRVYDLCDAIEKFGKKDLTFALGQGVRADKADKRLLKRMYEVGFKYATIAVEGGNNRVLRALRKGETIQRIERTIKNACEIGYEVRLLFVIGAKGETWKDIEDSFKIAEKYPVMYSRFNNLFPIPGTELYNWVETEKLTFKKPEEYLNSYNMDYTEPWYETRELSADERRKAIAVSDQINQRLFYRYLERKLGLFGLARKPLAYVASRKTTQQIINRFPALYKTAMKVRQMIA